MAAPPLDDDRINERHSYVPRNQLVKGTKDASRPVCVDASRPLMKLVLLAFPCGQSIGRTAVS